MPTDTFIRIVNIIKRDILNVSSIKLYNRSNKEYWNKLNDKHKGKRGFVIANGPSLIMDDLDYLTDEITIASNRIYLAYDKTDWRPNYFTISDQVLAKKIYDEVHNYVDVIHCPINIGTHFDRCKTYYWKSLRAPKMAPNKSPKFSGDISYGAYGGYSITYQNLQLAVHLGLNPIYIIGCDHNYKGENENKKVGLIENPQNNHFINNYRLPGEKVNAAPIDLMTIAHHHAKQYADQNNIQIINITRGGQLDVYERGNLENLF